MTKNNKQFADNVTTRITNTLKDFWNANNPEWATDEPTIVRDIIEEEVSLLLKTTTDGAYAAAAKLFESRFIRGDQAIFTRAEMVAAILALTPADARQASQQLERMTCGHLKADWVEAAHVWHQGLCVLGCTKAHCRTCAAIASAEARARLEAYERVIKLLGHGGPDNPIREGLISTVTDWLAAARTPDSTKEPE